MLKMKKHLSILLVLSIVFTFFIIPVGAASETSWNGKTTMKSGNTYIISKSVKVKENFKLPKNATLIIKSGGELTFGKDVEASIYGNLRIEEGGVVKQKYGSLLMKTTSSLEIYGTYLQYTKTLLDLQAPTMNIYENGGFTSSGKVNFYVDTVINNKGQIVLTKSSDVTHSAYITNKSGAELYIQGKFSITKAGLLISYGHLALGKNSNVRNSGQFIVEQGSSFTRLATITETKSGSFADFRDEFEFEQMTASILVDEPETAYKGIDVSKWQGKIDWAKVKADGIDFALIRAGHGAYGSTPISVDTRFEENIKEAVKNKIDVGVYFYSYAKTVKEIQKEAEFLIKTIAPYKITYPIILDIEDNSQLGIDKKTLTKMVEAFIEVLMEEGYYPMIYSYKSWFESYLDMTVLDKYAVWLAQWAAAPSFNSGFYIWQYSNKGKVNGIGGDVDLNISYRNFPKILKSYGLNKLK